MSNEPNEQLESVDVESPEAGQATPIDDNEGSEVTDRMVFDALVDFRGILETRLVRDKAKDEAFERLYEELDSLKRNKAFEEYRPLLMDLILLYDRFQSAREAATPATNEVLDSLQEELKEVLTRRDIEAIVRMDDAFDPAFQRAVCVESVESTELDGKVIRVLREGFTCRGLVFRPQEVVVGRYRSSHKIEATPKAKETE